MEKNRFIPLLLTQGCLQNRDALIKKSRLANKQTNKHTSFYPVKTWCLFNVIIILLCKFCFILLLCKWCSHMFMLCWFTKVK